MSEKLKGKAGIKAFLLANLGKVVTSDQIHKASGGQGQYGRRLRELREDEGWKILSSKDKARLKPDEYLLEEKPPEKSPYKFSRKVSKRVRTAVLQRNGYRCKMCGVTSDGTMDNDRPAQLHIDHVKSRAHGGTDDMDNLRVLCSLCNEGAKHLMQEAPSGSWIVGNLRTAARSEQREAYEFLKGVFEGEEEE